MMVSTAILAFPCGVLASVLNHRPILGLDYCLDTGVIPSATILIGLSPVAFQRARSEPFSAGFVGTGWVAVIVYVLSCRMFPAAMSIPVVYYTNQIEPHFMDADTLVLYSVSLLVRGFIMAVPQLLIALAGGLVARFVARRKLRNGTIERPIKVGPS
jgi:hypothetical protein